MGPSQQCRGAFDIEALAPAIAVDHNIRLPNYFRIADSLLTQANIYREEKNLIQLYVLLLRYSSLLCETIPKHRDYRTFKSGEKDFFKKKLLDVINELESLKPVVQQEIMELDVGAAPKPHCSNRTYAASCRIDKHLSDSCSPQDTVRHQLASSLSVKSDRQIPEKIVGLPYPKEDTLSRHSILGPAGLSGQWIGPVVAMKVQYPTNNEITPSDISRPKHAISDIVHYRRVDVPEELTACFLKAAETNTRKSLETCGLIFGAVLMDPEVGEYFRVTALIIPKQKSTSDRCEAVCEEEIPGVVQSIGSPYQLGWIHTHPTQDCFMSSVDLHNHYSYQVLLYPTLFLPSCCCS
ncbi:hypothetical protein HU200_031193 [Digitaria exilis]|uniref:MPN domain-containing protein n=1 Tax=Digitaria exilis TaxID=1010633 RepID=A0A835BVX1_9POAL|nr:hypothetical protein HU200_031193 [Digitaria exilis]